MCGFVKIILKWIGKFLNIDQIFSYTKTLSYNKIFIDLSDQIRLLYFSFVEFLNV